MKNLALSFFDSSAGATPDLKVSGDTLEPDARQKLDLLAEAERSGSTCLPIDTLLASVHELLDATDVMKARDARRGLVSYRRW